MAENRITVNVCNELREMSVGEWENMTFDEIREKYPIEYAARGERLGTVPPPGGESFTDAGERLINCLDGFLADSDGDIAIVAHGGVIRARFAC